MVKTQTGQSIPHFAHSRTPFDRLSPEARAENLAKARVSRQERARPKDDLWTDFPSDDEAYWMELARVRGVTMPGYGVRITDREIRRFLRKINRNETWFRGWGNFRVLSDFVSLNPHWPMRALAGLLLEAVQREKESKDGK